MENYFNIQCLNGHVWREHPESTLGLQAKARQEKGLIDALTVPCKECDQCQDEQEHQDRLNREYCDDPEDRPIPPAPSSEGWPEDGLQSFSDEVRDTEWFNNHPEDMLPDSDKNPS